MSDTTLEKIGKLLRKAENASTEEEAAAYQAMAQKIATKSAIDLEIARAHDIAGSRKPVLTNTSVRLGPRGKRGLSTYVDLFLAIARNNNVQCGMARDSTVIYPYGFDTDIEIVVALYESLVLQMVEASNAYIRKGEYKNEMIYREVRVKTEDWYGRPMYDTEYKKTPVPGQTARRVFQENFARTIGRRLRDARLDAEATAKTQERHMHELMPAQEDTTGSALSDSVAVVLVRKEEAVREHFAAASKGWRGTYKGSKASGYSDHASNAGKHAGNNARLSAPKAIGGQRTAVSA